MIRKEFDTLVDLSRARQDNLLEVKGADYTRQNPDRLWNFKNTANSVGLTPMQVWAIYASKHWDALMTYVKTGKVESEAIRSRFDDLHNYLYLGEGLIQEAEATKEESRA
jgi:hypothetical protein